MGEALFIGAGIRGAKTVGGEYQPDMDIAGKSCIAHVVEAAMGAELVGKIYIWGQVDRLKILLREQMAKEPDRIFLCREKANPIESFYFCYLKHLSKGGLEEKISTWSRLSEIDWKYLKDYARDHSQVNQPVHILLSDTPLITSSEIDYMISHRDKAADITMGRTEQAACERVLSNVREKFDYSLAVKNYYTYFDHGRELSLILNSYFGGYPLKIDPDMVMMLDEVYANRTIISGRKLNLQKLGNNYRLLKRFLSSKTTGTTYGKAKRARAAFFLLKSFLIVVKNIKYRKKFKELKVIFSKIEALTGMKLSYQVSDCFGAAFDVDTVYELEFIKRNFEELQKLTEENMLGTG